MNNTWLCVPSPKADDMELRNKLWNISIEMIERRMGELPSAPPKASLEGIKVNDGSGSENDEYELVNDGSEQ